MVGYGSSPRPFDANNRYLLTWYLFQYSKYVWILILEYSCVHEAHPWISKLVNITVVTMIVSAPPSVARYIVSGLFRYSTNSEHIVSNAPTYIKIPADIPRAIP